MAALFENETDLLRAAVIDYNKTKESLAYYQRQVIVARDSMAECRIRITVAREAFERAFKQSFVDDVKPDILEMSDKPRAIRLSDETA